MSDNNAPGAHADLPVDHREFGRLLADARESKQLTVPDVARSARIRSSTYVQIERGKKTVRLRRFARMHQFMGFDVNPLLQALPVTVGPVTVRQSNVPFVHRKRFGVYWAFAQRLVAVRARAKFTLRTVADAIGTGFRVYVRYESGARLPTLVKFAQLHRLFDFDGNQWLSCLYERPSKEPFHRFGETVRVAREGFGLTLAEAACATRCNHDRYARIERGVELPTIDVLLQLHRVLDFDVATALRSVWDGDKGSNRRSIEELR